MPPPQLDTQRNILKAQRLPKETADGGGAKADSEIVKQASEIAKVKQDKLDLKKIGCALGNCLSCRKCFSIIKDLFKAEALLDIKAKITGIFTPNADAIRAGDRSKLQESLSMAELAANQETQHQAMKDLSKLQEDFNSGKLSPAAFKKQVEEINKNLSKLSSSFEVDKKLKVAMAKANDTFKSAGYTEARLEIVRGEEVATLVTKIEPFRVQTDVGVSVEKVIQAAASVQTVQEKTGVQVLATSPEVLVHLNDKASLQQIRELNQQLQTKITEGLVRSPESAANQGTGLSSKPVNIFSEPQLRDQISKIVVSAPATVKSESVRSIRNDIVVHRTDQRADSVRQVERTGSQYQRAVDLASKGLERQVSRNPVAEVQIRDRGLLDRLNQIRESLRLQQNFQRNNLSRLSPLDLAQLKRQGIVLLKRVYRIESRIKDNNIRQQAMSQLDRNLLRKLANLPQAQKDQMLKVVNERMIAMKDRLKQMNLQLDALKERLRKVNDPLQKRALQKELEILLKKMNKLEVAVEKLRLQKLALLSGQTKLNQQALNRINRLREAMMQRRLANANNPELRQLQNLRRQMIALKSNIKDCIRFLQAGKAVDLAAFKEVLIVSIAKLMSQRTGNDATSIERMRRLAEIQLMLKEDREVSSKMLQEIMELLGEELEENGNLISKARRRSRKVTKKKEESKGFGLSLEEDKKKVTDKAKEAEAKAEAAAAATGKAANAVAAKKGPSASLDVFQAQVDEEGNSYYTDEEKAKGAPALV